MTLPTQPTQPTEHDLKQDLAEDLAAFQMDGAPLTQCTCVAAIRRALYAEWVLCLLSQVDLNNEMEVAAFSAQHEEYLRAIIDAHKNDDSYKKQPDMGTVADSAKHLGPPHIGGA